MEDMNRERLIENRYNNTCFRVMTNFIEDPKEKDDVLNRDSRIVSKPSGITWAEAQSFLLEYWSNIPHEDKVRFVRGGFELKIIACNGEDTYKGDVFNVLWTSRADVPLLRYFTTTYVREIRKLTDDEVDHRFKHSIY